jgi:hypothetical protein
LRGGGEVDRSVSFKVNKFYSFVVHCLKILHQCHVSIVDECSSNIEDSTGTNISWTQSNTLLLIEEYMANKDKMEKGLIRKKAVWEKITKMLCSKGLFVNGNQVNGKWKTLMRGYKSVKYNNKKSGQEKNHMTLKQNWMNYLRMIQSLNPYLP